MGDFPLESRIKTMEEIEGLEESGYLGWSTANWREREGSSGGEKPRYGK